MSAESSVFSYLEWRGDLSFTRSPFNEVDALILAAVSYCEFLHIVPPLCPGADSVLLADAARTFLALPDHIRKRGLVLPEECERLLLMAAMSPRFQKIRLFGYRSHRDRDSESQFAALSYLLPNGTVFLSFRGTDDSLVGWKEDMNMSFTEEIPAQKEATRYLSDLVKHHPAGRIWIGGHSKGGNLAIYAAATASPSLLSRIHKVYNFDGPGFSRKLLASKGYKAAEKKCVTYIPEFSLVGSIFSHDERFHYIQSYADGLMQHNPFTWAIERTGFVILPEQSSAARAFTVSAKSWLDTLKPEDRIFFTDTVYRMLTDTGACTLGDLVRNRIRTLTAAVKALFSYEGKDRIRFLRLFHGLVNALNPRQKRVAEGAKPDAISASIPQGGKSAARQKPTKAKKLPQKGENSQKEPKL